MLYQELVSDRGDNMSYTKLTRNKREQLKNMMDDFTIFRWGQPSSSYKNMFEEFGAFIIGGKNGLKFYNGPGFSNKYITTQFQTNTTTLESVEFKTMTISFTMGVYWFTIDEYRKLLLLFHPYEVRDLSFSFAPQWYYLAKLSNITDSDRHVLGKDADGNYRYYTEVKLTFEVQGEPCLHSYDNYTLSLYEQKTDESLCCDIFKWKNPGSIQKTDLDTPFEFFFTLTPKGGGVYPSTIQWPSNSSLFPEFWSGEDIQDTTNGYYVGLEIEIPAMYSAVSPTKRSFLVFEVFLKNLAWNEKGAESVMFAYDSSQGLLFLGNEGELLTSYTTAFTGKRVLEALNVKSFKIPGALESGLLLEDFKNIKFKLYYSSNWSPNLYELENSTISHARTNVV